MAKYRYPGTQSFQANDAGIFYGREADQERLLRLIRLEQVIVLYGKSGLGKSSLLNAGVIPGLQADTTIEEVRFGGYWEGNPKSPLAVLEEQLWAEPLHPEIEALSEGRDPLWCKVKSRELAGKDDSSLLLIFDQFEELFTYGKAEVQAFKSALATLLQEGNPLWLQQQLTKQARTNPKVVSRKLRQQLLAPLDIKVLLTVRSDHLSLLHQFTSHFPNVLVNLYELKPLNAEQARAAIIQPAQQQGDHFASEAFAYTPQAVQLILDSLANEQGEIESFQLQLLCQQLEQKVLADRSITVIEDNHFQGTEGIQRILHGYYERQLEQLPESEQANARRFIEEGLVIDGRRAAVTAGAEEARYGISPDLLQRLLDSRLIRAANIHLGRIYELSHDSLVKPVMQSLESRQASEEKKRIEQELRIAEEQNKEERRRRRRAKGLAAIGFTLFVLAALAGLFAWQKYQEAERNKKRADAAALAAQAWTLYQEDHTLAFRVAEAALHIDSTSDDAQLTLMRIANNPETSFYRKVLTTHELEVNAVAFSADNSMMATGGKDTRIILWDKAEKIIHNYLGKQFGEDQPGHRGAVTALAFSEDEKSLLSVSGDGRIINWSVETGEKLLEWVAHPSGVTDLAVIPGARLIATAGMEGKVYLWTPTGEKRATLNGHTAAVTSLSVTDDGQYILTTSLDGSVRLWSGTGQLIRLLMAGEVAVNAGCFVPNSQLILLGLENTQAKVLDRSGQQIAVLNGHHGQVTDVDAFEANYLLTAADDGKAIVWTLDGEMVLALTGHKKRLNFARISPDQKTIVSGGFDFTVKLWDVDLNLDLQLRRHQNFIYCVDIDADNQRIVTASVDGSAKIWNPQGHWQTDLLGHTSTVQSAFFIPKTTEVITAGRDGTVRIWSAEGEELMKLEHTVAFNVARATAGRDRIIAATIDGRVKVWDKGGNLRKEWLTNSDSSVVQWLAINPEGDKIATVQTNTVKIWNWEGELLDSFVHERAEVIYKVAFASDGQSVYTTAGEFPVRRWSLTGVLQQNFFGHTNENYWVEIHPELPLVATASWDQTVGIWDTSGNLQLQIPHPSGLYSVAFSSDGAWLVTGSHDNIGRIWSKDGKLLAKLGERTNISSLLNSGLVSSLADIPFSMTETQLPLKYLEVLAAEEPGQYLREGLAALELAQQNKFSFSEKLAYFDQAVEWLSRAKTYSEEGEQAAIEEQLAATFRFKGEQLLIHRQFASALEAFEQGLSYSELDYLLVLKTLALLYDNQREAAMQFAEEHKGKPVPQIEWYVDYNDAVINELYWFEDQFGISTAEAEALMEMLQAGN